MRRQVIIRRNCPVPSDLFEMILVPGGRFLMGSSHDEVDQAFAYWAKRLPFDNGLVREWFDKEVPLHWVSVEPFFMMRYPVCNLLAAILDEAMRAMPFDHPYITPSSEVADNFVQLIARATGLPLRLPSESEWEWAARGGGRLQYPWGAEFCSSKCNTLESCNARTTSVRKYTEFASPFGMCDMAGNVEEWTSSVYSPYPGGREIVDDISREQGGRYRIARGGSFQTHGDLSRTTRRHGFISDHWAFGLRLAVNASRDFMPHLLCEHLLGLNTGVWGVMEQEMHLRK
jgi:formylglycine-generating enzyme required for sulfatase activity